MTDPAAALAEDDDDPHWLGHRQRLRERFLQTGDGALADYEMIELLLFLAIPRRDVKPLAKELVKRFGSYAEVVSADPAALREVAGIKDAALAIFKTVRESALRLARQQVMNRPVIGSWDVLLDYCQARMAYGGIEEVRLMFLDRRNQLIADEAQQKGTVDHSPVYPREVVKRALELNASAVIMVHNHPSGDATPSKADREITHAVRDALKTVGIALHDHLVIGRKGHASFKSLGLL